MRRDDRGLAQVVCRVNDPGFTIIENLNGRNTLQGLARKLHEGFDPRLLEHTVASIASFVAMLAQAGLLSEPFFVNLEAVETTA